MNQDLESRSSSVVDDPLYDGFHCRLWRFHSEHRPGDNQKISEFIKCEDGSLTVPWLLTQRIERAHANSHMGKDFILK